VRWTEQRNFEAVLDLMATGKIDMKPLITHRFPFEDAGKAYDLIMENKEPYVGIILEYGKDELAADLRRQAQTRTVGLRPSSTSSGLQPEGLSSG